MTGTLTTEEPSKTCGEWLPTLSDVLGKEALSGPEDLPRAWPSPLFKLAVVFRRGRHGELPSISPQASSESAGAGVATDSRPAKVRVHLVREAAGREASC